LKKLMIILPFVAMLTGCPGENVGVGSTRAIQIDGSRVCFSVNKTDVLSRYVISSTQNGEYKEFAKAEFKNLSYPASCINADLPAGYSYGVSYTLNNENYRYTFFKDKDGNILNYQ
jgi:hypothetical protein